MQGLNKLLAQLLNLGTAAVSADRRGFVKQANLNGLIFFAVDLVLALVFYYILDDMHISAGLIVASFTFLTCSVGFNYLGWTTLSRLSTVSIGSFLILYIAFYLGPESFMAAAFLLGAIFPFVYFSTDEKKSIAFCLAVPLACYAFFVYQDYQFGPRLVGISTTSMLLLQSISFVFPFLGIVVNTYTAVHEREQKTKIINESQKLLETIFFALSHDLATPLQTISIISQLGERGGTIGPEKIKKIHTNSQQMVRIFKNLKTIAQTSINGKIALNMHQWSVNDLLLDAIKFINDVAATKNVLIEFDPNDLPSDISVNVDKDVFVFQIVNNFLTNSLKFSNPGQKIKISSGLLPDNHVQITIRDWGQGIEPANLRKLFSWSERTSTIGTNGEKGTGLGLPLAMKFLEAMQGQLNLSSNHFLTSDSESQGTLILIKLPIYQPKIDTGAA